MVPLLKAIIDNIIIDGTIINGIVIYDTISNGIVVYDAIINGMTMTAIVRCIIANGATIWYNNYWCIVTG